MNPILDANKLYEAGTKAVKSSSFKFSSQLFEKNQLLEIAKLQRDLKDKTYKPSPTIDFVLSERGKVREISANTMIDKTLNHCLCDDIVTPKIIPYLIYDNCASQINKGVSLQRKRLKIHLQKYFKQYNTNDGYVLLMDFKKYYANIDHNRSKELLYNKVNFDETTKETLDKIYLQFSQDGVGINIGHQLSQSIGILYPYLIDNYFKIVLGCKYYGRYTDDSYAIFKTKQEAEWALNGAKKIANELKITLHPSKTRIIKLCKPFYFLKIKYTLCSNGKVTTYLKASNLVRERAKLKKYKKKLLEGTLSQEEIDNAFKSWLTGFWKYMRAQQIKEFADLYIQLYGRLPKWKHSRLRYLMEHQLPQN